MLASSAVGERASEFFPVLRRSTTFAQSSCPCGDGLNAGNTRRRLSLMGESEVARPRIEPCHVWRQLVGCMALYAFFIQSLLASIYGAQHAANIAAAGDALAFEICLSGENAA